MIFMVLYDALPYAIGATGPKLGKKKKKPPERGWDVWEHRLTWVAFT